MNDSNVQVSPRVLTPLDIDRAVTVVTQAFRSNPLWCYMVPNAHHRMKVARQFFRFSLRFSINNRQVLGIGTPIVGIAVWRRPHQRKRSLSIVISSYLLLLAMNPRIVTFLRTRAFLRSSDVLQHRYASMPHYYLETLAVHPHYQGQGYATCLLQPILDQADREAIGTYTETMTPRNVRLYEHFGFYCKAQQHFSSIRRTLWALYRPPKRASSLHNTIAS
jgi:ribosomal protein S18 acetylase RimI-like enzyme